MFTRRDAVKLGAAGLVAPTLGLAGSASQSVVAQESNSSWPMFRGNPARTGAMPGSGLSLDKSIVVKWRFTAEDFVYSPAVADGVVYVCIGKENLYAIGNLLPTVLTTDVTLRGAPSNSGVERGTAKAGAEISNIGSREERNGETWVEVTIGDVTGWIPLDAIDPTTLPPEGDIEYIYQP